MRAHARARRTPTCICARAHAHARTRTSSHAHARARTHARARAHRYQIDGSIIGDVALSCLCQPCSSCQIAHTVGAHVCVLRCEHAPRLSEVTHACVHAWPAYARLCASMCRYRHACIRSGVTLRYMCACKRGSIHVGGCRHACRMRTFYCYSAVIVLRRGCVGPSFDSASLATPEGAWRSTRTVPSHQHSEARARPAL